MPKTALGIFFGLPATIFVGGILYTVLGAISDILPRFFKWGDNLSILGRLLIFLIIGAIAMLVYFKYLDPDDKRD